MDSGNSGSISSSDDEYDSSHADPSFLNHLASISHPQPSLVPSHPSMFDLSPTYLHALSQSHQNLLNLDSQGQRSEPNCTLPESLPSSSSATNQCPDNINNARQLPSPQTNNLVRNSKKRSRASRRAPTTVLTTDTTNFRSMVQEFTGIPAPPFSPSFSRRLPLRSKPLLSSSSSRILLQNNINVSPNNSSFGNQLLADLSLPYHQPPQNLMQNHPLPTFNPLHSLIPEGFAAKSLSMPLPTLDAHLVGAQAHHHEHVVSEGDGGGRRDPFRFLEGTNNYGSSCKLNMSISASTSLLNHDNNLDNNNINGGNSPREDGTGTAVEAWICSSHHQ
ncbi:hypothetical protein VNO78_01379 [Psophocarpus tetragonolobus]|uniref:VQ domain-containing protein n=1 Tax=Psophocarpus tetragonolobus TaxID=3891 RepID=A0AAN9XVI0_PSOTE